MSAPTVTAPIDTKYPSDIYGSHKSKRGVGGAQTGFASINEVYNIPVDRREPLMLVTIKNYGGEPALFWLKVTSTDPLLLIDNTKWELLPIGAVVSGGVVYQGNFSAVSGETEAGDPISDPPSLLPSGTENGDFYICNVAGTFDFGSGNQTFILLDYLIFDGLIWRKIPGSSIVDWNSISNMPQIIQDIGDGTFVPADQVDLTALTVRVDTLESNQLTSVNSVTQQSQLVTTEEAVINYAYSKLEVDNKFLLVPDLTINDFNWNRAIKRLPKIGETPGGGNLQDGLEAVYYDNLEPEVTINTVEPREVGYNRTSIVTGLVNPNQVAEITKIEVRNAATEAILATVTPETVPTSTVVNEVMPSLLITEGENITYKITIGYKLLVTSSEVILDSDTKSLNGVYPILYGAGDGLLASTIYAALSKLVIEQTSFQTTFAVFNQESYIGYPDDYGNLVSIRDNGEEEMINTLYPAIPVTIGVQNTIADSPWTKDYLFYISDYKFSATLAEFNSDFIVNPDSGTLDDIIDGTSYKKLTVGERNNLAYLMGESTNLMKASDFVTFNPVPGIVDRAVELSFIGINNTGTDIPEGRYVKVLEVDLITNQASVRLASKDLNDTVDAFAGVVLTANGGTGTIVAIGYNTAISTLGQSVGTSVYLGQDGTIQFTQPTTGSLIKVGEVYSEGNPGLIGNSTFKSLLTANFQADWRPNTFYPKHTKIAVAHPDFPELTPFLIRTKKDLTSAAVFDPNDIEYPNEYESLGGEMKIDLYDPQRVLGDAFDRDNMIDGTNVDLSIRAVKFTQTEKTKLANVQDPIYKGTFANPTDLRAEYPTSNNGDEASVLSTATTWTYVTNATNDWIDTLIAIGGDMTKAVYDPGTVNGSAFNMDNFSEGSAPLKRFFDDTRKAKLDAFGAATTYYNKTEADALLLLKADKTYVDSQDLLKMTITTYDPNIVAGDAFAMDNMIEGTTTKILTNTERSQISTNTTTIANLISGTQVVDKVILDDLTGSEPAYVDGQLFSANGGLNYHGEFSAVTLQIGQEQYIKVHNNTGVAIANGRAVRQTGVLSGVPTIALAKADLLTTSRILGLATMLIPNGQEGLVTTFGSVSDIDTDSFVAGDTLYLSDTDAGFLVNTAPDIATHVGAALNSIAGTGKIFVSIDNHISLPTIYGALSEGSAGTTFVADTYQPIANYVSSDNVVMSVNAITGTITTPVTGKYVFSANLAMAFDATGNQNETLTIGIHDGTSIIKEIVEFLPKTAEGSSLYPHFIFDGTAGISYHIEVKCSAALTGVTYSLSEFDMTSVHIR